LLQHTSSAADIQDALKEILLNNEDVLQAEIDEHLGFVKHGNTGNG